MKKLLFMATCTGMFYMASAQQDTLMNKTNPATNPKEGKYCLVLKEGKPTVILDGRILTDDVKLTDGSKLTVTGGVVKRDGSRLVLKNGDCIDKHGSLNEHTELAPAVTPTTAILNK